MSPAAQRLRLAVAATLLAGALAACQGADAYYRNRGVGGAGGMGGMGLHPDLAGFSGAAGAAGSGTAGGGAAGSTAMSGAAGTTGSAGTGAAGSAGSGTAGSAGSAGTAGAGGADVPCTTCMVKVQYTCRNEDSTTTMDSGQASFLLDVTNEASTAVPLSSLTLRYWYTIDAGKEQELDCDFAKLGCTNIVTSADTAPAPKFVAVMPPKTRATEYAEIAFKPGALALDPFLDTGELQLRLHNKDFSPIKQADDYSYDCSMKGNAVDAKSITAYVDGVLVWGTEPP